jgi:uncharacterized protein involved in type VI secretion and phage assembly
MMNGYELMDERDLAVERKRLFGVYPAQVTSNKDPDGQGRVRIRLPWSPDAEKGYEVWARLSTFMAGPRRGAWFIPDPKDEDEVLVGFEGGDPRRPYVLGSLWNGKDAPPQSMDKAGKNFKKSIVSRKNIRITLDDSDGKESVTIETPGGQRMTLTDGPAAIELTNKSGSSIRIESAGITIRTSAKVKVQASQIEVTAGMVTVNAGMSKFSGVVKADTVITNSIISASYSPGAGNIW